MTQHAATPGTPEQALARLMEGNRRFAEGNAVRPELSAHERRALIHAQAPFAAVLGCADSRVPVEIIFDQGLGDLFVVRVAGNVASPGALASLEFAVDALSCRLILVLGHRGCGAVQGALEVPFQPAPDAWTDDRNVEEEGEGPQLPHLLHRIRAGLEALPELTPRELTPAVDANVRAQVTRVRNNPVIARALAAGAVEVVGAFYDTESSEVRKV
ncbi:MAG: carbonic anhydrase [Gemmatimonadota bacterium]